LCASSRSSREVSAAVGGGLAACSPPRVVVAAGGGRCWAGGSPVGRRPPPLHCCCCSAVLWVDGGIDPVGAAGSDVSAPVAAWWVGCGYLDPGGCWRGRLVGTVFPAVVGGGGEWQGTGAGARLYVRFGKHTCEPQSSIECMTKAQLGWQTNQKFTAPGQSHRIHSHLHSSGQM